MPSTITAEKAALRKTVREISFSDDEKRASDTLLLRRFLELPEVKSGSSLLLYYGVGREPDTAPLLEALLSQGKLPALPRCLPGGKMEARRYLGHARLVPNSFGIPEPDGDCPTVSREELSLILVPGLSFDERGFRLGHGGGYYDRYLERFGGLTVALCRDKLLFPALPIEKHDRPVHRILTETRCLSFFQGKESGAPPRSPCSLA